MAKSYAGGIAILALGLLILLGKLGVITFLIAVFWPLIVIGIGLILHMLYVSRSASSILLIPAGLLVTYGLLFQIGTIFGWGAMAYLWPGFILGAAVGCYEYFLFDHRHPRAALAVSIILGIIAGVLFGITLLIGLGVYVLAVLLIALGAYFVFRRARAW